MKLIAILLVTIFPFINAHAENYIPLLADFVDSGYEHCQRINAILNSALQNPEWKATIGDARKVSDVHFQDSYNFQGNFIGLLAKQSDSDDLVIKNFTFNYDPVEKLVLNITTMLPRNTNLSGWKS